MKTILKITPWFIGSCLPLLAETVIITTVLMTRGRWPP